MKYYIIAGEASGDLHASNLMRELMRRDPGASFRCWGGDMMEKQGATLVKHYRELAFMGFSEVLMNIRTISGNLRLCYKDISEYQPDVIILVDYPGFNLRIAKYAKKSGFRVFYYISPQVWAWKQSRVKKIRKYVDRMYVILPFERNFYKRFGMDVDFVGHPLLDAISEQELRRDSFENFTRKNRLSERPIIAVLPGSRKQEIKVKLPLMLGMKKHFPDYQFIVAGAPSLEESFYRDTAGCKDFSILFGQTYEILQHATAAMVTSGTATLEAALFNVPEAVCYKSTGPVSYYIARSLIRVRFISLVNLIMDKEVVKELIQDDLTPLNLKEEMDKILFNSDFRAGMLDEFRKLRTELGGPGASGRAAELMYTALTGSQGI
ncbi:MAG: lipid-A-disaccharide synthase [Bacteroidetes bacterium]|nr:lipid-A-disaccharide synthase [Bacteroidota bacterium]